MMMSVLFALSSLFRACLWDHGTFQNSESNHSVAVIHGIKESELEIVWMMMTLRSGLWPTGHAIQGLPLFCFSLGPGLLQTWIMWPHGHPQCGGCSPILDQLHSCGNGKLELCNRIGNTILRDLNVFFYIICCFFCINTRNNLIYCCAVSKKKKIIFLSQEKKLHFMEYFQGVLQVFPVKC